MVTETEIIAMIKKYTAVFDERITIPIGDDTAFLPYGSTKDGYSLFTTDQLVEGVHFSWKWCTPSDVAYKLVQMNLSDIFAKGGTPTFALLNLQLSQNFVKERKNIRYFAKELGRSLAKYRITLLGGDTTSSDTNSFMLTLLGECNSLILRKSSQLEEGDILLLFGDLGGSAYALSRLVQETKVTAKVKKYYTRPKAKSEAVAILNELEAKISMDVSDSLYESIGLFSSLNHAHIRVDIDQIPHPKELQELEINQKINYILGGGEDFSILFSAPKKLKKKIEQRCKQNQSLKIVGNFISINKKKSVEYFLNGIKMDPKIESFRHFF